MQSAAPSKQLGRPAAAAARPGRAALRPAAVAAPAQGPVVTTHKAHKGKVLHSLTQERLELVQSLDKFAEEQVRNRGGLPSGLLAHYPSTGWMLGSMYSQARRALVAASVRYIRIVTSGRSALWVGARVRVSVDGMWWNILLLAGSPAWVHRPGLVGRLCRVEPCSCCV